MAWYFLWMGVNIITVQEKQTQEVLCYAVQRYYVMNVLTLTTLYSQYNVQSLHFL